MYRNIATEFWTDSKIEQLKSNEKLLMLYLLTAPHGNLSGCFEVTYRRIEIDTMLTQRQAEAAMARLCEVGIIVYAESTSEVLITNWWKHNWSKSPKTKSALEKQIERVNDPVLKGVLAGEYEKHFNEPYPYPIDTVSVGYSYPYCTNTVPKSKSVRDGVQGKGTGFSKPTEGDVREYAESKGYCGFDASRFIDHYESNGWKVGKNPMKDWKAAVRNWARNDFQEHGGAASRKAVVGDGRFSEYD